MKKISVILIAVMLLSCMMSGCSDTGGDTPGIYTFSLAEIPTADEKVFELTDDYTLSLSFELEEAGLIKMVAYDATEYIDWPEEIPEIYVDFKDEGGKALYENVQIDSGYTDKYYFEKGTVVADIRVKNQPEKMDRVALSWAFAADNYEPVAVDYETNSAAPADENGIARFALAVEKDSLVRIFPAEACIYESDCSFYVETKEGEKVTGDISIHGTEWTSRLVFLTKGDYIIVVNGIEAAASCKVREEKAYGSIQLTDAEGLSVPVTFGFNLLNSGERTAKFTADGSKYLVVNALGTDTFYDSVHYVDVVITDANGNVVMQSEVDAVSDETRLDISSLSGEYTVTVSTNGTAVVDISLLAE